jgi:peptidylprolyl isomerase
MKRLFGVAALAFFVFSVIYVADADARAQRVEKGKQVKLDYVLFANGEEIANSQVNGPIEYTQGEGQIMPGLEKRVEGMKVGEKKSVVVPSDEAFGPVRQDAFREFPKAEMPQGFTPQAGQRITLEDNAGRKYPATIVEVRAETIIIDLNHPLAGQDLRFDVTVIEAG